MNSNGFVSLVGAGPGDAELLTLKALRLLKQADAVLYDRLVSQDILDLIPTGVSRIAVGKSSGRHSATQNEINDMLVGLAKAGHHIVRLKGGDPYLFGRGSEEALFLRQHHIDFEIVPGITAASGTSAYSGIPLTHRGISRRVQFITGHFMNDEVLDMDWNKIADPQSTLVIYMGLSNIEQICQSLIVAGMSNRTPAAAIEEATTNRQRRVISSLETLAQDINKFAIKAPALIIIGEVVSFASELDWFQQQIEDQRTQDYEKPAVSS
jgi:uroporphyrin-III C-methyltransferase/precorrin-2 dehydrogenase/sirohydrochlorin ferrochelatase/uroporphyrin-III C-methyltransferase